MGRTAEPLERLAADLPRMAGRPDPHVELLDVTEPTTVQSAFEHAVGERGPVHVLVNNAGGVESAPFRRTDAPLWHRMLALNLDGPFHCAAQVVPSMVTAGDGRIVNVASTAGLRGYPYVSAYCAAKHGLVGFTRALARELAGSGVTVNAVCPGYTDTDLVTTSVERIAAATRQDRTTVRGELVRTNPSGRLVRPEEVAVVIGWLCLPAAAMVTGEAIAIDGGELA
jgi:NAD(P)-dependent dehydrogenase (short-subunit alcohol dehydrogenase family)